MPFPLMVCVVFLGGGKPTVHTHHVCVIVAVVVSSYLKAIAGHPISVSSLHLIA